MRCACGAWGIRAVRFLRSEVLVRAESVSTGRTHAPSRAFRRSCSLGFVVARGRRVSGAGADDRRRLPGRRHGGHRGPPDGRVDEEDVHEGRRRPQPAGRRRFRRDGGSRAGEARRLHRDPRAELDPGDPSAAQRAAVQDAGRLRAHPEHDHLLHAPHREGGRAVEDHAGVHGRGQGESRQAPRRLARRGDDQPPDARAVADPRRLQDDARAVLGLGRDEPRAARRPHRRRDGAARRGEAARRRQEAPRAGGREPAAASVLPGGADGQGSGARRRDRHVVRAHGAEGNAGARAEGAPRFREGRAWKSRRSSRS